MTNYFPSWDLGLGCRPEEMCRISFTLTDIRTTLIVKESEVSDFRLMLTLLFNELGLSPIFCLLIWLVRRFIKFGVGDLKFVKLHHLLFSIIPRKIINMQNIFVLFWLMPNRWLMSGKSVKSIMYLPICRLIEFVIFYFCVSYTWWIEQIRRFNV